jgi:curved DNA-binding protein CbpA
VNSKTRREPNHYEILDIARDHPIEDISRLRTELSRIYHPNGGTAPDAERLAKINNACDVLGDPKKRKEYDLRVEKEEQEVVAEQAVREQSDRVQADRAARAPSAGQAQAYGDRIRNQAGGSSASFTESTAGSSTAGGSSPPRTPPPPPPQWFQEGMRPPVPSMSQPEYRPRRADLPSVIGSFSTFIVALTRRILPLLGTLASAAILISLVSGLPRSGPNFGEAMLGFVCVVIFWASVMALFSGTGRS